MRSPRNRRRIAYTSSLSGITPRRLAGFFAGWPNPPSARTHLRLLQESDYVILAVDKGTDAVVGFITAVSDRVLSAYIPLLEVLPEWQGKGIGSELLRRMHARLSSLYMVDTVCDPNVVPLYRRFGMTRACGMILRRLERQSG